MAELYAFDSNVYISALRNPHPLAVFRRVLLRLGMRARVNSVVAYELRAGAHNDEQEEGVEELIRPYADRDLVVVPSFEGFVQAGRVLAALVRAERMSAAYASPSLRNDVLIATSCREHGVTLVTDNAKDFSAIRRHLRGFRFTDLTTLATKKVNG